MSDRSPAKNAFSESYLASLRERDEPAGPWSGDAERPLVIREVEGKFGLFRPWQDPAVRDEPEAVFDSLEDARLALAAHAAIRHTAYYRIQGGEGDSPDSGYAIEREGVVTGRMRYFDPAWIHNFNVLTCMAQESEHLATLLYLAGPMTVEEVGEILGRSARRGEARPEGG